MVLISQDQAMKVLVHSARRFACKSSKHYRALGKSKIEEINGFRHFANSIFPGKQRNGKIFENKRTSNCSQYKKGATFNVEMSAVN